MNKRLKARWIKALLSGNYLQGEGRLRQEEDGIAKFCCLGVLQDVCPSIKRAGEDELLKPGSLGKCSFKFSKGELADAELTDTDPSQRKLSDMNDNGESFKQIAKWIDKYL